MGKDRRRIQGNGKQAFSSEPAFELRNQRGAGRENFRRRRPPQRRGLFGNDLSKRKTFAGTWGFVELNHSMKVSRVETIVIGAGFAGLSAAYHLAKSGHRDVLVIEQDKKLGGHSSGRNAGMIRQAIQDPVLARLAVEGRKSLGWETRRWKEVSYRPNGSLLLAKGRGIKELKETAATLKAIGLGHRWYSKKEACDFVSALKQGDFEEALFCPTDAFVEIQGLLQGFLKALRRYKIEVLCGYRLNRIQKKEDGFLVEAGQKKFFAKRVVNAAGAWAGLVGEKAGAAAVPR